MFKRHCAAVVCLMELIMSSARVRWNTDPAIPLPIDVTRESGVRHTWSWGSPTRDSEGREWQVKHTSLNAVLDLFHESSCFVHRLGYDTKGQMDAYVLHIYDLAWCKIHIVSFCSQVVKPPPRQWKEYGAFILLNFVEYFNKTKPKVKSTYHVSEHVGRWIDTMWSQDFFSWLRRMHRVVGRGAHIITPFPPVPLNSHLHVMFTPSPSGTNAYDNTGNACIYIYIYRYIQYFATLRWKASISLFDRFHAKWAKMRPRPVGDGSLLR